MEQKNLHEYVDERIENAETEETKQLASLERAEQEVIRLRDSGILATDPSYTEALRKQAKANDKLTSTRRTHYQFQWLRSSVMPIVPENEFQTLFWLLVIVILSQNPL